MPLLTYVPYLSELRWLALAVLRNSLIALCAALLFSSGPDETWVDFRESLRWSLLYSFSIGMLAEYSFRFWYPTISQRFNKGKVALAAGVLVVCCLVGTVIANILVVLLGMAPWQAYGRLMQGSLYASLLITLILGGASIFYNITQAHLHAATLALRTQQLERERAEKLAAEAHHAALASRVQPHFLFNSLNSISALIREDPTRAERLVEQLAALLRHSLYSDPQQLTPLSVEVRLVQDYLALEQARFGNRLRFQMQIEPSALVLGVPPFAVQTLVENSIKYAVARQRAGAWIGVNAWQEDNRLHVTVRDDGPGFEGTTFPTGHGLDNLRARLLAFGATESAVQVSREEGHTVVSFALPAQTVQTERKEFVA